MYTHFRKRKTSINLFRYHEINASYLWPLQLQEVLKVVAISFQTLISVYVYVCMHFLADPVYILIFLSMRMM